jgi:hypothetical protein
LISELFWKEDIIFELDITLGDDQTFYVLNTTYTLRNAGIYKIDVYQMTRRSVYPQQLEQTKPDIAQVKFNINSINSPSLLIIAQYLCEEGVIIAEGHSNIKHNIYIKKRDGKYLLSTFKNDPSVSNSPKRATIFFRR